MGRRKKLINNTDIPQHKIEAIARCIMPDILAFYESEEGQREFAEWKKQREAEGQEGKKGGRTVTRLRPPFLRLWGCFLLPGTSRFGGWPAPHPVAEIGAFVAVKEKQ